MQKAREKKRSYKRPTLRTTIFLLVSAVVIAALLVTDLLIHRTIEEEIEQNQTEKAQQLARAVALMPVVQQALVEKETEPVQQYVETFMGQADVQFVVIIDMDGIRYAHPDREKVGKAFVGGDETEALNGNESVSTSVGTLGRSLRAFTPVYAETGEQVGAVAVGISLEVVEKALQANRVNLLIGTLFGLSAGLVGAVLLSRFIKKTLFHLEPRAIATLVEERSAMLQSTIEGMIAVDADGKITLVNKSAQAIFDRAGLPPKPEGVDVEAYMQNSRLRHVLASGQPEYNKEQDLNGLTIVVNRVPVRINDQIIGAIATFRDKTEMKQLAEQLTGVKTYASTLRAQTHEFKNRLQVILGMLHTKEYEQVEAYVAQIVGNQSEELKQTTDRVKDPVLAGLLLGKKSDARENGVDMKLVIDTVIEPLPQERLALELTTILGNLIDNGIDAASGKENGSVKVTLYVLDEELIIRIADNGPGMSEAELEKMYVRGYSTKGKDRGYGLSLVKQSVEAIGAAFTVESEINQGTTFTVFVPIERGRHT
ncbi:sensor histidine kinase [Shouchella clausii]|uniref:sensor histidine kinase n=1 Tax=Shouchella clausii TaxID=79880 RepID=UPI000794B933|nr:sensor histidine kinase [Shouchella clausii]KKI84853.1 hypothetical protein WZ76_18565 [Shouchella clausii]